MKKSRKVELVPAEMVLLQREESQDTGQESQTLGSAKGNNSYSFKSE